VTAFADRADAGRRLAARLEHLRGPDLVVLGLPRGGVTVAYEVARLLEAPLDVLVVRKVGAPGQPELAMGAVGEDGVRVVAERVLAATGVGEAQLAAVEQVERAHVAERVAALRGGRPPVPLAGRTALIVDDGIATGSTVRAGCAIARARGASSVVVAAPVAPRSVVPPLREAADEVVCLEQPVFFAAVSTSYRDFAQVTDEEVLRLLERAPHQPG